MTDTYPHDSMGDMLWLADRFEEHRPRLLSVACRLLGSLTEAEDALRHAWIQTTTSDGHTIENAGAWLITLVGRVCVDMLRARKSRAGTLAGAGCGTGRQHRRHDGPGAGEPARGFGRPGSPGCP